MKLCGKSLRRPLVLNTYGQLLLRFKIIIFTPLKHPGFSGNKKRQPFIVL